VNEKRPERRGLGRGLSALMADVQTQTPEAASARPARADQMVPVERIAPNPDQPRRAFDDERLRELAESIREKGVIQPLILRRHPSQDGQYQIVAGERRWRAAQLAQLHEVPALIRDYDNTEVLEIAIIENIQRADLNPLEEAAGYRQLMERFGHTQERIAEALGKSRSHIANLLRLLGLPGEVQEMLRDGRLTSGHARALVTSDNAVELARQVVAKGLSVRETEKLVKAPPRAPRTPAGASDKDADTKRLEEDLSAALGLKLEIRHNSGQESGQMILRYRNLDELDELCGILTAGRH